MDDAHYTDAELESDRRSHQGDMDDAWAQDESEWDASQRCEGADCANPECDGHTTTSKNVFCNDCFQTINEDSGINGFRQSKVLEQVDNPIQYL